MKIDTLTGKQAFFAVGNAHNIQLQTILTHQLLALALNLGDEAMAYSADAADEEVQYLVF